MMTSLQDIVYTETDELELKVYLTGKEIQLMRNVLSDVENDPIGIKLNLKIANAILESLDKQWEQ